MPTLVAGHITKQIAHVFVLDSALNLGVKDTSRELRGHRTDQKIHKLLIQPIRNVGVILVHGLRGALKVIFIFVRRKLRHQGIPLGSNMLDINAVNGIKIGRVETRIQNRALECALRGLIGANHLGHLVCQCVHMLSPLIAGPASRRHNRPGIAPGL